MWILSVPRVDPEHGMCFYLFPEWIQHMECAFICSQSGSRACAMCRELWFPWKAIMARPAATWLGWVFFLVSLPDPFGGVQEELIIQLGMAGRIHEFIRHLQEAGAGANICWDEQLFPFGVPVCSRQKFLIWVVFGGGGCDAMGKVFLWNSWNNI